MKAFKKLFLIIIQLTSMIVWGQDIPNILSPDVATLGKYGSFPVSFYTGTPEISIPLYELKCDDVTIPISLNYDASGFLPNRDAGIVGQNWTMASGGLITRSVNGIPDDKRYTSSSFDADQYGYLYGIRNLQTPYSAEQIKALNYFSFTGGNLYLALPYEHTPDIFTFNFNGHTGKFLIDNTGQVKVISNSQYKVDISKLSIQNEGSEIKKSIITIYDPLGYQYVFGGGTESLEVGIPLSYEISETTPYTNPKNGTINAWYLSKIVCPNKDSIKFNYQSTDLGFLSLSAKDTTFFQKSFYYAEYQKACTYTRTHSSCGDNVNDYLIKMALTKLVFLKEIVTNQCKIEFLYSRRNKSFNGTEAFYGWRRPTLKLDKMTVTSTVDNSEIKKVTFNYDYYLSEKEGYRIFLSQFTDNDQKYIFEYYKTSNLPHPTTKKIDLWGYYTSYNNTGSLLPSVQLDTENFPVNMSHRKSDTTFCSYGLLRKIVYPTGGSSEFKYEGHSYETIIRQTGTTVSPDIVSETGYAGGARIKSIINSPGETHHYFYGKGYKPQATQVTSSGILFDFNTYCAKIKYPFNSTHGDAVAYVISSDNIAPSASIYEAHIGYTEVTEIITSKDGGYIKRFYSNYLTNPDNYLLNDNSYKILSSGVLEEESFKKQMRRLIKYSGRSSERGMLMQQTFFKSNNDTIQSEFYTYNTDPNRFNNAVYTYNFPFAAIGWGVYNAYAIYTYPNLLSKKITKEYGIQNISQIINYKYNLYNQILEQNTTKSDQNTISAKYKYPSDYTTEPYKTMAQNNILTPVIESETSYTIGNTTEVTDAMFNQYKAYNGIYKPELIKKLETISAVTAGTNYSSQMKEVISFDYNNKGRMIRSQQKDGINTTYIWGYDGEYPIAKVENAKTGNYAFVCDSITQSSSLLFTIYNSNQNSSSFHHVGGNVSIAINGPAQSTVSYSISGPVNTKEGTVCTDNTGICLATNTYYSLPKGFYQVTLRCTSSNCSNIRVSVSYFERYAVNCRETGERDEFFYASFEEDASANTGIAAAGVKYHQGSYTVPYIKTNSRQYQVDYRYLENGVWKYKQATYTNQMQLSDGTAIDEVRVYPVDALMTTYTYKPLAGINSETDPSGRTIFYIYDDFGRLKQVKDDEGKILKEIKYNYAQ